MLFITTEAQISKKKKNASLNFLQYLKKSRIILNIKYL